ncbi:MAG TPA: fused MFS/spermidine synthase [Vicinamibacterales bacterium]|nr:fused MFS/spermidine synthase [Vicinamibacterales bacterium]
MTDRQGPILDPTRQYLPALMFLFVGSGCAALIYEVVWFQLLSLTIGSSAISLGVLLGTFMGGMCLGSYLLPRYIDIRHHPLRVYAYLEIGIGVMGLLLLFGTPVIEWLYTSVGGGSIVVRAIVAGACLLPPTLMMGATLPAVARWVKTSPEGVSWMGFFYGGNIAGAVIGSLLAGFYLLRVYDMAFATFVAAFLNITVAVIGLGLARQAAYEPTSDPDAGPVRRAEGAGAIYVAIAVSGMTALSAQVVWTRLLSLLFGATVYTFSLILGVFLFGLGIGSTLGAALARGSVNPRVALGWVQMALAGALFWAAYMLTESLPFWPINPSISSDPWFNFQLDMVRALWVVLPGAILWGLSFPLALAAVAAPGQDPGRLVGGVYAANTVGAIVGALGTGLVLVQTVGSQSAQMALIVISALTALMLLAPSVAGESRSKRAPWAGMIMLLAATAAAGLMVRNVPPVPGLLVAYGRYAATWVGLSNIIYVGEGLNAFVAVTELGSGVRNYHNAGKVQASSEPQDMRLQRMLGHMTHLIPDRPSDVLVIGFGAGATAGSVAIGPNVERVTIAEIEPLVPQVVSQYFSQHNYDVARNPKVTIHLDDARHYLLTTDRMFDAITSDPLDPWVKGAATLYTKEFFEVVRDHLNPGGVVTLFVQLYESNTEAVKSEIGTFFEVFPNGVVWGNTNNGQGYDLVVMGQNEPIKIDVDAMQAKFDDPAYAEVVQSFREIGIYSAIDLFANYAGQPSDMAGWLAGFQINRDRNLRLQYLAGMGLNLYESGPIYSAMIAGSRYPDNIFEGSPETLEALRLAIQRMQGR